MKKFLIHIALFALLIIGIAFLTDVLVSKGLQKTEKNHAYTFNKLMNDTINADVLIMGNSRGACSYNTKIIDKELGVNSQNISVSGQPFGISHLRYEIYKKRNCKPKLIILNIDYLELDMHSNGYEREQYYPYVHKDFLYQTLLANNYNWGDLHIPMYRYRGNYKLIGIGLLDLMHIYHVKTLSYKGFYNPNTSWDETILVSQIQDGKKIKCKMDSTAIALLDSFAIELQQDSIPLAFVYAPIYKDIINNLCAQDSVLAIYQTIAKKYNFPLLNYSQDMLCNDTLYFYNGNHLNTLGAELFTRKLVHAIDSLNLVN